MPALTPRTRAHTHQDGGDERLHHLLPSAVRCGGPRLQQVATENCSVRVLRAEAQRAVVDWSVVLNGVR
jgi:hypothetical protein